MGDSALTDLRSQATAIWQGLGLPQKIGIAGVGLFSIAMIAVLLTWARTTEYSTAFSNLKEEDAAAIVAKLKESKTPYELASGGTAIRVPAPILYDTRLQMASTGLPQGGGAGFELFNQTNFGMTDFVQKVNYQRALEGELSRTINRLGPVEQSRVHIVLPQPTLYTDNQKEASASVVLKLKPGQRLKESQIRGIAQLLSSSVEGLKPENLTIIDADGDVLSDSLANGRANFRISSSQMDSQKSYETDVEQKIQGMLDRVLGSGKATVRVRAQFDWDQFESSSETYSPSSKQPQVRSARETVERSDATPEEPGGAPGTRANVPSYTGIVTGTRTAQGQFEKRETTTNYELSKTVEKISKSPGTLKKLSVAVVLDTEQPLDAGQLDELGRLVSAAAGIDPIRGDVLAVSSMPHKKDSFAGDAKSMEEAQQWERNIQLGKLGAMAVGPVLLLLLLVVLTRRGGGARRIAAPGQLPSGARVQVFGPQTVAAIAEALPGSLEASATAREDPRQRLVKEQVANLAKSRPEAVADLIKTWLDEDGKHSGSYSHNNEPNSN